MSAVVASANEPVRVPPLPPPSPTTSTGVRMQKLVKLQRNSLATASLSSGIGAFMFIGLARPGLDPFSLLFLAVAVYGIGLGAYQLGTRRDLDLGKRGSWLLNLIFVVLALPVVVTLTLSMLVTTFALMFDGLLIGTTCYTCFVLELFGIMYLFRWVTAVEIRKNLINENTPAPRPPMPPLVMATVEATGGKEVAATA